MRAVEDDLAGVTQRSYGECEMELGQSAMFLERTLGAGRGAGADGFRLHG